MNIEVTVLAENTVRGRQLLAEHGWACYLRCGSDGLLWDTGQGMAIAHNARELGLSLTQVQTVVLSHGHYDHTNGLAEVWDANPGVQIVGHSACTEAKFRRLADGSVRDVGMKTSIRDGLTSIKNRWNPCDVSRCMVGPLWTTGPVPRITDFEDTGGDFYLDDACQTIDPIVDDQAFFFDTAAGIVVLLGCAHAGVINTLMHICQLRPNRPIDTVIGGMHLGSASQNRIRETIRGLTDLGVQRVAPSHCTGFSAAAKMRAAFGDRCEETHVGKRWLFSASDSTLV
ncbi:MBL fold metallo-hydrolase [Crateriforma spongiae]|uniref:MBL fold metallo-hydrolase n=1 Tax=Crateriforma spongiae TaxID=2724528 RepID=UPI0014454080|nr:MBL fold metallo-hydrolase [Crateriforma spongiae]